MQAREEKDGELSSDTMNAFVQLCVGESAVHHCFDSGSAFLLGRNEHDNTKLRWWRHVQTPARDVRSLFIPVHTDKPPHWSLFVVDVQAKSVLIVDSLAKSWDEQVALFKPLTLTMVRRMPAAVRGVGSQWACKCRVPCEQTNGVDCGVYALAAAYYISREKPSNALQGLAAFERKFSDPEYAACMFRGFINDVLAGRANIDDDPLAGCPF